jgi:hypothetical protein
MEKLDDNPKSAQELARLCFPDPTTNDTILVSNQLVVMAAIGQIHTERCGAINKYSLPKTSS